MLLQKGLRYHAERLATCSSVVDVTINSVVFSAVASNGGEPLRVAVSPVVDDGSTGPSCCAIDNLRVITTKKAVAPSYSNWSVNDMRVVIDGAREDEETYYDLGSFKAVIRPTLIESANGFGNSKRQYRVLSKHIGSRADLYRNQRRWQFFSHLLACPSNTVLSEEVDALTTHDLADVMLKVWERRVSNVTGDAAIASEATPASPLEGEPDETSENLGQRCE